MRTIELGGKKLGLRARPSALRVYHQQFDRDLVADMNHFNEIASDLNKGDISRFNSMLLLQVVYALHQAYDTKKVLPNFDDWLDTFDYINLGEPGWMLEVVQEVADGFFRAPGADQATKAKGKVKAE